jgi:hypothetical protein
VRFLSDRLIYKDAWKRGSYEKIQQQLVKIKILEAYMDLAQMLAEGMGGMGCERTPIAGEEREKIAELMQHIPGLKPGDKVQWKRGFKDSKYPGYDKPVEVFRTFQIRTDGGSFGSNHYLDESDFSVIFRGPDSNIMEYAFDSRRFEKVTE